MDGQEFVGGEADEGETVGDKGTKRNQADVLVDFARRLAGLFHSTDGFGYAQIKNANGRQETVRIRSLTFRRWLSSNYYKTNRKTPGGRAIEDAIGTLEGLAFASECRTTGVRVLQGVGLFGEDNIYVDLANDEGEIVEISKDGWRVIKNVDAPFLRPRSMLSLPKPESGGYLEPLWDLLNLSSPETALVLAWTLMAFHPSGPYPVLSVIGPNGRGKSLLAKALRMLTDPSSALLRGVPKDERDLWVSTVSNWVIALDNVSNLSDGLSDGLCRVASGAGYSTRQLWSDSEEFLMGGKRPVAITSIPAVVTSSDLADRAIVIIPPKIEPKDRKTERELFSELDRILPGVLGKIFDGVSMALRNIDSVYIDELPRMADFALWIEAASPALGYQPGELVKLYKENREDIWVALASEEPVVLLVDEFLDSQTQKTWAGNASGLLSALILTNQGLPNKLPMPSTPSELGRTLNRVDELLGVFGIQMERKKPEKDPTTGKTKRVIELKKVGQP